jgi:hypothetical protein
MIKCGIAALALAFLANLAHADEDYLSPTNERVRVSLGVMKVSSSTTLQVDSTTGTAGTVINGEDDFGLDKSDIEPKFQVMVRAGERNRVFFDYFTLDRSGNIPVAEPIEFRDVLLQPGDPLQSQLNLRMLSLTYGYSFWHGEKLELAATLGITSVEIAAQAKVQSEAVHVNESEDQAGPFPTPGIAATWAVSKHFYFDGRVQYLDVHVNNLEGSLGFLELDALYRLTANVSFALGYTEVKAHVLSDQAKSGGLFDFDAKGPEFFVRVAF